MKGKMLGIGILAVLLLSSLAMGTEGAGVHKNSTENRTAGDFGKIVEIDGVRYTTHDVIRINNNTDFSNQAAAEGWPGDGSQGNPYIISGYDIDAHGAGDAIYIGNTTAYFVVENCYLHNASYHSWPYSVGGLIFYNTSHGSAENNTIVNNNWYGISICESNNNTIVRNNITENEYGLYIYHSENNVINRSNITNNQMDGISLDTSNSNTIEENNLTNNGWGSITIQSSTNSVISNNKMVGNSISFWGRNLNTYITQNISNNNTVNGKPVYYYKNRNMNNQSAPQNAGEVILGNVSWLNIENLNLSDSSVGIVIGYSSNILISNNNISNNNIRGIYLEDSSYINIQDNNISYNRWGVALYQSINNKILRNNITNSIQDGIIFQASSNNNLVSNNKIYNKSVCGIEISGSSNNEIINNDINNEETGIYIGWSTSRGNIISGNNITNNSNYGVEMSSSTHNRIYDNFFIHNYGSESTYNSSHIQAYDDGTNNYWNSTSGIGNYWYDWANNNNTNDQNHDGIVDWPYKIDGSANAKDYYPLKNTSLSNVLSHPLNLRAVAGNEFVNLTWEPPAYGSNTVTQYKIYRNGSLIATTLTNQLYYNDTNVVNGQTYTYYVTVVNSVGESDKSNEVQATPGGSIPEIQVFWLPIIALIFLAGILRKRKENIFLYSLSSKERDTEKF